MANKLNFLQFGISYLLSINGRYSTDLPVVLDPSIFHCIVSSIYYIV